MRNFILKISKFSITGIIPGILFILPCFFVLPYQTGDIGKFGIPFGPYDTIFYNVDYCYVNNIDNFDSLETAEIITIGDSFSQGYQSGYQNFMGHKLKKNINNFRIKNGLPENTAYTILEKKLAKKCKVLVVESVERYSINGLTRKFFIIDSLNKMGIISNSKNIMNFGYQADSSNKIEFNINNLLSYYLNKISTRPYIEFKLSQDMFTCNKYTNSLFIYNNQKYSDSDLLFINTPEKNKITAISNLKKLYDSAKKRNIKLIYLVCADKYDLYYNWIENNPYPENKSLDYFKEFDRRQFVDTKELFIPYLNKGVKDIYRVNDTHWSIIGAQIVGEHLADIIINEKYLQ